MRSDEDKFYVMDINITETIQTHIVVIVLGILEKMVMGKEE